MLNNNKGVHSCSIQKKVVSSSFLLMVLLGVFTSGCVSKKCLLALDADDVSHKQVVVAQPEMAQDFNALLKVVDGPLYRSKMTIPQNADLEISRIGDTRLEIKIRDGNEVIYQKICPAKISNEQYVLRKKVIPIGLPFVFFWYYESVTVLDLRKSDELVVKHGYTKMGNILLNFGKESEVQVISYRL